MPVSKRVSASERFRGEVDELFASGRELGQILEEVARLGVALLFQTAFESEVTEFLGRNRYARGERERDGLRNGYSPITSRARWGRSRWSGPSCGATRSPSCHACSA